MILALYSIWLVPCEEQRGMLQDVIDRLAGKFGTPAFMPHATLCSGEWNRSEAELAEAVERLAAELPVELGVDGIDWTDRWLTFFFLRLCGADRFFEKAAAVVEGFHLPAVGPHLSLMYSFGDKDVDRNAERAALDVPPAVLFNRLALVSPGAGCWQDVPDWNILHMTG